MACFIVPAAEALVVTLVSRSLEKKASKNDLSKISLNSVPGSEPMYRRLKKLSNLLWGGSALLAFEHLWHGEIVPWFPFLTAAETESSAATMLHEMAAVGVSMAAVATTAWAVFSLFTAHRSKVAPAAVEEEKNP